MKLSIHVRGVLFVYFVVLLKLMGEFYSQLFGFFGGFRAHFRNFIVQAGYLFSYDELSFLLLSSNCSSDLFSLDAQFCGAFSFDLFDLGLNINFSCF